MKELEKEFLEFDQKNWNEYVSNIILEKPYHPMIPGESIAPALELLGVFNVLSELKISTLNFKNAVITNYSELKKNPSKNVNALSALISISAISKPDYAGTLVADFKEKVFIDEIDRQGRNLHSSLLAALGQYKLQNELKEEINNILFKENAIKIDDYYDYYILQYFLYAGMEKEWFDYLLVAYKNSIQNKIGEKHFLYSMENYLFFKTGKILVRSQ